MASRKFKIALCQMMCSSDKLANLKRAKETIAKASNLGANIVSLPECFNSPYATSSFPVYAEEIPSGESSKMLMESAKENKIWLIGGSIPEREGENVYNTSIVINPEGEIVAKHRKIHLFDIDVPGRITFKESDTLTAGKQITVFETPYCRIGLGICYDMRFPEQSQLMKNEGAEMIIFPGAFNMTTGPAHWELLLRGRAVDNQLYVCGVSPARNPSSEYQAWGHSTLVSPWGEIVITTNHDEDIIIGDVDLG